MENFQKCRFTPDMSEKGMILKKNRAYSSKDIKFWY